MQELGRAIVIFLSKAYFILNRQLKLDYPLSLAPCQVQDFVLAHCVSLAQHENRRQMWQKTKCTLKPEFAV